jgi:sulfonate transport system substrate-binding protein
MSTIKPRRLLARIIFATAAIAIAAVFYGSVGRADDAKAGAVIPNKVPPGTTLVIGDPMTQEALTLSGEVKNLPFTVRWANISGGPKTIQAFRAHALDLGAVADIPPIHANWTGLPVKIVAARFRQDPINHPIYQIGIAPGAKINSLSDLRGKKIAYSPGQAQGVLVLRILKKAGLTKSDVRLVELPSTDNVYENALASNLVDAAPFGVVIAKRYEKDYGRDGAKVIGHGLRDDAEYLYAPTSVLADPAKAAAIREYVKFWARAQLWIDAHPDQWIAGYFVGQQGLSSADGHYVVAESGRADIPASWTDVIKRQQATIDLLAGETGEPRLNAADIFDRRYEYVASQALANK